jgi:hypothetical protein
LRTFTLAAALIFWIATGARAAEPAPEEAVSGIVKLFDRYDVVMLGEAHDKRQLADLYISLVRDAAFQGKVNDIVIEFASRHNQPLLDRFILKGEEVPFDQLCPVWRDISKVAGFECPIYQEWLAAIRDVNLKLPANKRLRVLAGDVPIDWTKIKSKNDYTALELGERGVPGNDVSFVKVINEQLDQKRKVLFVVGLGHIAKLGDRRKIGNQNAFTRVEAAHPGKTCVVHLYLASYMNNKPEVEKKVSQWKTPSLYWPVKGSWLANETSVWHGNGEARMEQLMDGLLYLGPSGGPDAPRYDPNTTDQAYYDELKRRAMIVSGNTKYVEAYRPKGK